MNQWIIINNGKTDFYENFDKALDAFLTIVSNHLWSNSMNNKDNFAPVYDRNCTPSRVGMFFEPRYSERTVSDEEIVVESRLGMLLDYFLSKNASEIKNNALKVIKHSIKYHSKNEEFREELDIEVYFNPTEIIANIIGEDSLLKTNAFIFDNVMQKYFFYSKQKVVVANAPNYLGKIVELDIRLQPYDEEVIEELYQKQKAESEAYIIGQYRKYAHLKDDDVIAEDNLDEWALTHVSCYNNYDINDLRELLLRKQNSIIDGLNVTELVNNEFKNHSELMKKLGEDDEENN